MKTLTEDSELKAIIPPLLKDEYKQLESNIIKEGCREPILIWGKIIIDGHNRYAICKKNNIGFKTVEKEFNNKDEAKIWIIDNQKGRRNLTEGWKFELLQKKKELLKEKGRANISANKGGTTTLSTIDKEAHNTRQELANELGWSTGKIAMADKVWKEADTETKDKIKSGDTTFHQAHKEIKKQQEKEKQRKRFENLENYDKKPEGKYDVIVIDPPWPMKKIDRDITPNQTGFDYPTMTEKELSKLEIPANDNCHLWLWTTQKFLPMALRLLDNWDFKYICTFVWHKPGGFQPFGLPQYNCEFALYARKGNPEFFDVKAFSTCFNAPRGKHSEKPQEFYDIIKRVTAGRKIDMFNRREIEGFEKWGDESGN